MEVDEPALNEMRTAHQQVRDAEVTNMTATDNMLQVGAEQLAGKSADTEAAREGVGEREARGYCRGGAALSGNRGRSPKRTRKIACRNT